MLIICNDLNTEKDNVKEAVANKDANAINAIVNDAIAKGFNALELYAGNLEDEAEGLSFLADTVENSGLTLIYRIKNSDVYDKVLPNVKSGIVNPVELTPDQADDVFPLLNKLEEDWKVLFTQTFGDGAISPEVEGYEVLISKAEQQGILPERIYYEPISDPIKGSDHSFIKMKRMLDAFSNGYPSINFYINLPLAAKGLKDEVALMNALVALSEAIGVNAFSMDLEHAEHIEAINAAAALLDLNGGLKAYLG